MKKKFLYQLGYGGVEAFLAALVVAYVLYFFFYPSVYPHADPKYDKALCVIDPVNATQTITLEGKEYVRIKQRALSVEAQIDYHFARVGEVTINEKKYPYFNVWLDDFGGPGTANPASRGAPGRDEGGTYRPTTGAKYLRFVDVSGDDTIKPAEEQGYVPLDIYLEKGQPLPEFIQNYCNDSLPAIPVFLTQDTFGQSQPPIEIESGVPSDWSGVVGGCGSACDVRPNEKYRIFAYEKKGSNSYNVGTNPSITKRRSYTITSGGSTVTYTAYYLANSAAEAITLVPPDGDFAYKYTPLFNVTYLPGVEDLHQKNPLQADMLQLEGFLPFTVPPWGWWTPECKPAVYLYPKKETVVNVQVAISNGFLTYTDPLYPKKGWTVVAKPNGQLQYVGKDFADSKGVVNNATGKFPYLYYEGKVQDSAVSKPQEGFIKKYEELGAFYDELLPKLGLNEKETKEFKDYWIKALPKASYYFIGIIPQEQLDANEPLTITPQQDTLIRVRLYFEAIDQPKIVEAPMLVTPQRNGFTVVDWGGMVKQDKTHPFTCLQ